MKYAAEWEHTVERVGRWVDFDKDYKTMYPWFMERLNFFGNFYFHQFN
jgi:isoleucyl-tRNA synthetase